MGESGVSHSFSHFSFTDVFEKHLPYYLSMGMSYDLYWYGDPKAVIAYRKAKEIQRDEANTNAWLQGAYIYQALCCVSPIFRAFAKKGTKPVPYIKEPFELTAQDEEKKEIKAQKTCEKQKAIVRAFMIQNNARFKRKGD